MLINLRVALKRRAKQVRMAFLDSRKEESARSVSGGSFLAWHVRGAAGPHVDRHELLLGVNAEEDEMEAADCSSSSSSSSSFSTYSSSSLSP